MYEPLIADLRNVSEYDSGYAKMMYDAADAIEDLAAFKAQITDGRFYVYKLGKLFELKHDPRELVVRYQDPTEPPKEEENDREIFG